MAVLEYKGLFEVVAVSSGGSGVGEVASYGERAQQILNIILQR